jgi:hypothetical protein
MRTSNVLTIASCVKWMIVLFSIGHSVAHAERLPIQTYRPTRTIRTIFSTFLILGCYT